MAKKAASVPKEGIFLFKNSKGFGFRIKSNKFVLVTAQGYNSKQGARKGLYAAFTMLKGYVHSEGVEIIDLTLKKPTSKRPR